MHFSSKLCVILARKVGVDYRFDHSYPDSSSGSANGGASCGWRLGKMDCWACLVSAKGKIYSVCDDPVSGWVDLKDCSLWFKLIP
ncbi:hypothetical protein LINPERPRIM_LOCUS4636 [Linum perenne]